MITIIGATHPGQREHNEDCYAADDALGLGLVADGMGGYACGEVASELVKSTIEQAAHNNQGLVEAIAKSHQVVRQAAALDASKNGMGSTAIAVRMQGLNYELAWVGDSRAYLWDGQQTLKQISRDHSYVETLLSTGAISYQEAINHPNRNLITQAVGVAVEGELDIGHVEGRLSAGQQLILCSDGLVDEVLDSDIARLMIQAETPEEALNSLVRAAVVAGGHDNITVVIVTADATLASQEPGIEPEIIRSTTIDTQASDDGPTLQRPQPGADITQLGMPVVDDHELSAASTTPGSWQQMAQFLAHNTPLLLVSVSAIVLMVFGLFYYA